MKKTILAFLMLTCSVDAYAKDLIKVAIVDTGLDLSDSRFSSHLCALGHKDLTDKGLQDKIGHGTHVAGIIQKYAKDANYCMLIYKYYLNEGDTRNNLYREIGAFYLAIQNGANIINFSSGGSNFNEEEYLIIKNNPKVLFVVAAGNDHQDLDKPGENYYPASYRLKNIISVGNLNEDGTIANNSNYGSFLSWELGTNIVSTIPCKENVCTQSMSGTSMATAVKTGKILKTYKAIDNKSQR